MARDRGLEELIHSDIDELADSRDITEQAMFGGWVWLVRGNLLCGAAERGMLVRLGKGRDGWALELEGVAPMMMSQSRRMNGWVRASANVYGDDALRRRLLTCALEFVATLPGK